MNDRELTRSSPILTYVCVCTQVLESKKRVDKIDGYLAKKQWAEVQSELTRQVCMYVRACLPL